MSAGTLEKESTAEACREAEQSTVDVAARKVYRSICDNLESVGGIETAAGICGIDRGDLRRALDRKSRYLAVEHVMAIVARMRRFNAGKATEIAASVVYPMGFLVFPLVELPAEEKARRLEKLVRSMPLGDRLVEEALKTP
jgi:hypothetical protein